MLEYLSARFDTPRVPPNFACDQRVTRAGMLSYYHSDSAAPNRSASSLTRAETLYCFGPKLWPSTFQETQLIQEFPQFNSVLAIALPNLPNFLCSGLFSSLCFALSLETLGTSDNIICHPVLQSGFSSNLTSTNSQAL